MMTLDHNQAYKIACEIAGMVRREGVHDFRHESAATLCGLCVYTNGDAPVRLHATDLDVVVSRPANDHCAVTFRKGSMTVLEAWHKRLGRLQASFVLPVAA